MENLTFEFFYVSPNILPMLIYNITVHVENEIAEDWLRWVLTEYGPELLSTNCFSRFSVLKLLDIEDTGGPTYAVQCYAESRAEYERYADEFSAAMERRSVEKWGQRFVSFSTIMEVIK
jgi:hypothetical protein